MNILVTGGAGFIGSHLVERLILLGHRVVVLDDFSSGRRANLRDVSQSITLIEGSITDRDACASAAAGMECVFHLAALGSVPRSIADPITTHAINATGTLNVLQAAEKAGARRLVYAASSSAYGDTPTLPKEESMHPRPRSPYAVAKLTGEQYCAAFFSTYGLEALSLRYFNVYGPRQNPEGPYAAVIPRFMMSASGGTSPEIFGDGEQTRDFTYVDDVVDANLLAMAAPASACGRVFNIGAGHRTSLLTLWRIIASLTGSAARPRFNPPRAGDVRDSLASLVDAARHLGYAPKVAVEEGLRRTLPSFAGSESRES